MSRTIILVVDGLGVGAMPDAGALRPADLRADTLAHTLDHCRQTTGEPLRLPVFGALGLGRVRPHRDLPDEPRPPTAYGRAALGYPGADTYAGHQTMMGADFRTVTLARLREHQVEVAGALRAAGHSVALSDGVLLVDDQALVHDNLEADPGVNWNVSAPLTALAFGDVLEIARTVRDVAPVARVIAVGGHPDEPLSRFVRQGDDGTVGLDTPASGLYRNGGLEVQHLGAPLDHTRQLPELAARAGVPVTLVGKAADILACAEAERLPAVPTARVLAHTRAAALEAGTGGRALVVANVQETDLAGHQQDPGRFGALLERVDAGLGELISVLDSPGDRLIVTGDHGNDPLAGHPYHTREFVPVLVHQHGGGAGGSARRLADAGTLADVGATAARALGLPPSGLESGEPLC
ncbi:phosphopentomutase [Streptomyces oceani]|uniref:Mutase n=1 Tax=Streptomyces oceani TaxID=1075402 RepID=A0A1E7JRI9_9ACTN|nr:phosphopentomutase [Streptomyces oceani]OEU91407.1 mutase [Streptomyces oceani]